MSIQRWTKLVVNEVKPPARSLHATCSIAGPLTGQKHPLLMVVGGVTDVVGAGGDVWLLDVDEGMWSEVGILYMIV